ncbi:LapA family protein [Salinibacterium sp. ZJ454]|uniref:LapA family protein n=1 Tax=Salinibacterium sp. ZJ454 TaxID=2708339 RepID=UPI00141D86A3|nr:LapA family protein [Salinibacterium sp. ZJ454]
MSSDDRTRSNRFWPLSVSQWVSIALLILAVIFIAQNLGEASVGLLWMSVRAPLWLVLGIIALIGFVAGWLMGRRRRRR